MSEDRILRALTEDQSFRVIVADTTHTARGVIAAQNLTGDNAKLLAELTTMAVLYRQAMSPEQRVQCILRGAAHSGTVIADSYPDGNTRGLMQKGEGTILRLGSGAVLQMARTLFDGRLHQGFVAIPGDDVSAAMMAYLKQSEQVLSMTAAFAVQDEAGEWRSGGYLVQLLPDAKRGAVELMAARIENDFPGLAPWVTRPDFTADLLMSELLFGIEHTILERTSVRYRCWCSEERVLEALATLERSELQTMASEGTPIETTCDYCHQHYRIEAQRLMGLLQPN